MPPAKLSMSKVNLCSCIFYFSHMFPDFGILPNVSKLKCWNGWSLQKTEPGFLALFSVFNRSMILSILD